MNFDDIFTTDEYGSGYGTVDDFREVIAIMNQETAVDDPKTDMVSASHKLSKTSNNNTGYIRKKRTPQENLVEYSQFYKTPITRNSYIINAINGNYYPYLVGSADEKMLFKVGLSNGQSKTTKFIHNELINEPCVLFYDSPEQFERHFSCIMTEQNKQRWHERRNKYLISTQYV